MSAFRPHTCLFRTFIKFKSHKSYSRTFRSKFNKENKVSDLLVRDSVPLLANTCVCHYSKTGSLTDDILKSRVVAENEKGDDKKEKSQEKESKWTGKNAWKLGLLSLGGSFTFLAGSVIYLWGKILGIWVQSP